MPINQAVYQQLLQKLASQNVTLVAVSKTKPIADLQALYDLGQRNFGENYVQEMLEKQAALPADIKWHFIGHLQSNKVKYIAPFVHLIHGVDSYKLLQAINKQAAKNNRIIQCLLQVHIAQEETKFGFDAAELANAFTQLQATPLANINVIGLMGMGSFSNNPTQIKSEFESLQQLYKQYPHLSILSMGMSGDYETATAAGSNLVRIGSLLFGARN